MAVRASGPSARRPPGPTRAELMACAGRALAPVVAPGLDVLFCGINPGLYRAAFGEPMAALGEQAATIGATRVWVLPNPSGLNAHHPPPVLAAMFAELRAVVRAGGAAAR